MGIVDEIHTVRQDTPDRQTRLQCNTGSFDIVVAISERMLNAQLESYFERTPEMQTMKQMSEVAGDIDAVMLPPRVSIAPSQNNRSSVFYHVQFESGKVQTHEYALADAALLSPEELAIKDCGYDVKGWEFCFTVDIGMFMLMDGDALHR